MIEFQHQTEVVRTVGELRAVHPEKPIDWICSKAGISRPTFFRFKKNVETGAACINDTKNTGGRPPKFTLSEEEALALRAHCLKHDSMRYAIEQFARDERCSADTRTKILEELDRAARRSRDPQWPVSLQRAARVTANERAEFRGKKHLQSIALAPRKGMFWEDASGQRHLIRSHTAWMMDDYSTNQPYVIEVPVWEGGRVVGTTPQVCRQMLVCGDLYSGMWLGVESIGRERDAYRAEDILRFILHCIDAHGTMPQRLILERGRWDSKAVHGIEVWDGHRHVLWGGLGALMEVSNGFDSRHKAALESNLSVLQTALHHTGADIGRKRGEFELATTKMLAVNAGRLDPRAAGFLEQAASEELHAKAMDALNRRPKTREAFDKPVVPMDLMEDAIVPRPLPVSERWRFCPVKREATIRRGGLIEVAVKEYPRSFLFAVNGVEENVCLENGYAVLIAFDPARPDLGCHVANAEMGSRNRNGYGFGQKILHAMPMDDVPMWSEKGVEGPTLKRRAASAHRAGFVGIKKHLGDHRPLRVAQSLDEDGRVNRSSNRPEQTLAEPRAAAPRPTVARRALNADAIAEMERRMQAEEIHA